MMDFKNVFFFIYLRWGRGVEGVGEGKGREGDGIGVSFKAFLSFLLRPGRSRVIQASTIYI